MREIGLVTLGGAAGAAARHLTDLAILNILADSLLITGTFTVNVLGCFLLGGLFYHSTIFRNLNQELRLLLLVGFIGSYTTYSTFAAESVGLFAESAMYGVLYIAIQIPAGFLALWLGIVLMKQLNGRGRRSR